MLIKKYIVGCFFLLFIGFSLNGFAAGDHYAEVKPQGTISQHSGETPSEDLLVPRGVLQASLKVSDSSNLTFQNFKGGKKYFSVGVSGLPAGSLNSFYNSYSLLRTNSISVSPFYIAYHRLII